MLGPHEALDRHRHRYHLDHRRRDDGLDNAARSKRIIPRNSQTGLNRISYRRPRGTAGIQAKSDGNPTPEKCWRCYASCEENVGHKFPGNTGTCL